MPAKTNGITKTAIRTTPAGTIAEDGTVFGKFMVIRFDKDHPTKPFYVRRTRQKNAVRMTAEQAAKAAPQLSWVAAAHVAGTTPAEARTEHKQLKVFAEAILKPKRTRRTRRTS